jgi:hypothetical protein
MRLWKGNLIAFNNAVDPTGTIGTPVLYALQSQPWRQRFDLDLSGSGFFQLPDQMPTQPNILSRTSIPWLSGAYKEREFSNFIYMKAAWPDLPSGTTYELGTYGSLGQGDFTIKFSYDYTSLDANIRDPEDQADFAIAPDFEFPNATFSIGVSGHWQLNEDAPDTTRISRASGFIGDDMTLTSFLESGASAIDRIEGIVASGTASGWAMDLVSARNQFAYRADSQAPNTLRFDGLQADGVESWTIAGWFAPNDPSGLDPNIGVGLRPPWVHTGIFCSFNTNLAVPAQYYRVLYNSTLKRFQMQYKAKNTAVSTLYYHPLNVATFDNGFDGGLESHKWYFICCGYNANDQDSEGDHGGGFMFFRVNDGPVEKFPLSDDQTGLITYSELTGAPFALGAGETRTAGNGSIGPGAGAYDSWTVYRGKVLNNREMLDLYNDGSGVDWPFPEKRNLNFDNLADDELALAESNPFPLRRTLRSWYNFNESSGTLFVADSQRFRDLEFNNPVDVSELSSAASGFHTTSGLIGTSINPSSGALEFRSSIAHSDGTQAASGFWEAAGTAGSSMLSDHNFSIMVWYKPQVAGNRAICGIWQETGNLRHWRLTQNNTDGFTFIMANGSAAGQEIISVETNYVIGRWYMILVERDNSSPEIVKISSYDSVTKQVIRTQAVTTFQYNNVNPGAPLTFGAYNTNDSTNDVYGDGDIGAYGLWNRLLSDKEKNELFNNGIGKEFQSF